MPRITGTAAIARLKELNLTGWTVIEHLTLNGNVVGIVESTHFDTNANPRLWLDWITTEHGQMSLCLVVGEVWEVEIEDDRIIFLTKVNNSIKPLHFAPPHNARQFTIIRTA